MDAYDQLVVFSVDERRFAFPLSAVKRVVRMVDVTPLPGTPKSVLGVIDVAGSVIPVVSARECFSLPSRSVRPSDVLLIVNSSPGTFAVAVDSVEGVRDTAGDDVTPVKESRSDSPGVAAVINSVEGLILIPDVDALSPGRVVAALGRAESA